MRAANSYQFQLMGNIWDLRYRYPVIKTELLARINSGKYRFSTQQKIIKSTGQTIHLWGSQDALVKKLMANQLRASLALSTRCTHVKGHGGLKQTIVEVQNRLGDYRYVCKTDVKGFYESEFLNLFFDGIDLPRGSICFYILLLFTRRRPRLLWP